jgi:hypothetical protein
MHNQWYDMSCATLYFCLDVTVTPQNTERILVKFDTQVHLLSNPFWII